MNQVKRKKNNVHGWLVLDKPQGITSTRAVGIAKFAFQAKKAGHAGTLDPLATGILPIAFGEATKTVPYIVDGSKSYRFTIRWGIETDTDDSEGREVRTNAERPSRTAIEQLLPDFLGEILQVPPQFSAVKVEGERAYDLAREGEDFELKARPVVIERLVVVDMPGADMTILDAGCGKGTYVRAIARDLGRRLGCFGHVTALRRTRVGPFGEAAAVPLALVEETAKAGFEALCTLLRPVEEALADLPSLTVSPPDAATLARGQPVLIRGRDAPVMMGAVYALCRGRIIAIGEIEKGALHPTRVFNFGG